MSMNSEALVEQPSDEDTGQWLGAHRSVQAIRAFHGDMIRIRHALHRTPELGFEEFVTSDLVAGELERYGVDEIHRGIGRTGVVGVIRGRHQGSRSIGLRADMDALPMQENNEFEHRSTRPGFMHGCGHDGHTTMLLGAARHLAHTRGFAGTVNLIFQPGEEGFAGAQAMIDDGLFDRFPCDKVFAMHNWPALPAGTMAVRGGPVMAAADQIEIEITGRGGHGAHPHLTVDPVLIAGHIITAVQSIVSRNVSPVQSAAISLCAMHAGDLKAMSVVPSSARLVGTVRTFLPEVRDMIERRLNELVTAIAHGFGATATVSYKRMYPATVNDVDEAQFAATVGAELVGDEFMITDLEPSMGAEDFSFMLQQRPGAYLRIGQGGGPSACFLHNPGYDFNDSILPLGAALFVRLAERYLCVDGR